MSEEIVDLLERTDTEQGLQTLSLISLIGFFTYCAIKLLLFSMIKQEEVETILFDLKKRMWRLDERLQDTAESATTQQEDLQQDLRILQERLCKFGEEAEIIREGLQMLYANALAKNTHSLRELEHYYKFHFEEEEQEAVD